MIISRIQVEFETWLKASLNVLRFDVLEFHILKQQQKYV